MKKLLMIAVVICVFLFPSFASAGEVTQINSYDVNIVVNENNTYDITENVTAVMNDLHGLRRDIPLDFDALNEIDGEVVTKPYHVIVSNVNSDMEFSTEKSGGMYTIKLGNPDEIVQGEQNYNFSYTYDAGEDGYQQFDQFYYNIIGSEWDTSISNVTFTITMPKEFDASKIGFSLGTEGTSGYENIEYTVEGNVISGKVNQTLSPYEALTIRLELPNGYYVDTRQPFNSAIPLSVISLVLLGIAIAAAIATIRKRKPVETVEFYPPEGMTSADVGYVIDGVVEKKDIISLIIYWADKGFLEIHQTEKSKDVTFKKIMDLPETANKYEKVMFDSMFAGTNTTSTETLKYKFADTITATEKMLLSKYTQPENRVFTKASLTMQSLMIFLAAVPVALLTFFLVYQETYDVMATVIVGMFVMAFGWVLIKLFATSIDTWKSEKRSTKVKSLVVWSLLSLVYYAVILSIGISFLGVYAIIPIIASLIMTFIAPNFRNWTEQGIIWAGRILGLKNFIKSVELDKLKMMVNENPQYFYNILPYAYVLGLTDKWSKQFETIAIEPPRWYYGYGYNSFSTVIFASALMHSMNYTQASMISKPPSSGGGSGFSGGGFSGGGFGGGGGGGW